MKVWNKEIREAVEKWIEEGNTWGDLARKLKWVKPSGKPDIARVKRSLGLTESHSYKDGERYTYYSKNIHEQNALAIVLAIDRAPNEFDL